MTTDTPNDACPHCGAFLLTHHTPAYCEERTARKKAESEVERLKNGFQGSCYCCEPVGEMNQKLEAEVERLRDAFSHLTNEIECPSKCLSHQGDHCDCGRLERAYAISHSIAQNPTK